MSLPKTDRKDRSISGKVFPQKRFVDAIAVALRREYGGTHAAIKTVVALTGANERSVKNWFDAKNGPSGESLISLCSHSDEVLEAFLLLAGRTQHVKAKRVADATNKLREILVILDSFQVGS
jgi:hypothetical protein